jgi:dTDP-glucose 4,6-dehydratase
MSKTVMVSGAGGFAGHHFLEHALVNTDWSVIATDSFRHKGKTDRIAQVLASSDSVIHTAGRTWRERTRVLTHDLNAPFTIGQIGHYGLEDVDYMVCFASESHVDRSISDPVPFIRNNTEVALNTLELAWKVKPRALVWISTDEVYGPVEHFDMRGHYEWSPIIPSNPYSASKAAQEAIAISYWRTYGVPLVIVNSMNLFGERQDVEKFVPKVIRQVLHGDEVTIHGTTGNVGTRHYLHARNLADAILFLLKRGEPAQFDPRGAGRSDWGLPGPADRPDRWNVASPDRIDNLTLAQMIAVCLGKDLNYRLEDFHGQRPGHDPHYGLDPRKLAEAGWKMPVPLGDSLARTVAWTTEHEEWLLPG